MAFQELGISEIGGLRKKGDTVEGFLTGVEESRGKNKSNIYTLVTKKGKAKVWGSSVIDMRVIDPQTGKIRAELQDVLVRMVHNGDKASTRRKGKTFKDIGISADFSKKLKKGKVPF